MHAAFLPRGQFGAQASRANGLNAQCKPCAAVAAHDARIRKVYSIGVADYEALLRAQDGKCYICRTKPRSQRLAIDHDHKCCGKGRSCGRCVRGLLCKRCNRNLLGSAHDDVAILQRAIAYLTEPPAQSILSGVTPVANL